MNEQQNTRPILLVDLFNVFTRQYAAHPDMTVNGSQSGGIVGTIKSIANLCNQIKPKAVYVIWESGGSSKRKAIMSEYKGNRNPSSKKLNRFYGDDIPDTEDNKVWQIEVLAKALKSLPVCQVYVKNCEGDDVIAYLRKRKFKDDHCVIFSGDKDFYQLLDDKTKIYDPAKKILLTDKYVTLHFGISPQNFALAKAVCGDTSDNIPGVKGVGFKTLRKLFPALGLNQDMAITDIVGQSRARSDEGKGIRSIGLSEDVIRRNWKLIYLDSAMLSSDQIEKIEYAIDNHNPQIEKLTLKNFALEHGLRSLDVDSICVSFMCLTRLSFRPLGEQVG